MSSIDDNFAKNMIAHHEQVNQMANQHMQEGDDPNLKDQAQGIATHAQGVISNMHGHLAGVPPKRVKSLGEKNI